MKRFHDTDLWDKEWFMVLKPKLKCLVQFIFAKCDQAGVWSPNWVLASSFIAEKVSLADIKPLNKHFEILPNGKIFVLDFIKFQYGQLTEKCAPHRKVISLLKQHGLEERVLVGYQYPTGRAKEEYKEEEEDKDIEEEEERGGAGEIPTPEKPQKKIAQLFRDSPQFDFEIFEAAYKGTDYEPYNLRYYYESALNWSDGKGEKKLDWVATVRNFMLRDFKDGKAVLSGVNNNRNGQSISKNRVAADQSDYERDLAGRITSASGKAGFTPL